MKLSRPVKGFTLLEVLVALGVLAVALGAITQSIGSSINNVGHLKAKTYAHWVAMNRVAEHQVMQQFPNVGSEEGSEEMGGNEWFWKETVVEAPLAANDFSINNVRRISIEVRGTKDDAKPLVTIMTFIGQPIK